MTRDWLRTIRVRVDGTTIAEREIGPALGGGLPRTPVKYVNLYPMSTVVVGLKVFIVRYCTQQATALNNAPLWGGSLYYKKIGFLMEYNLSTNVATNYRWFNTPGNLGTAGAAGLRQRCSAHN